MRKPRLTVNIAQRALVGGLAIFLSLGLAANVNAGAREQAKRIHDRLVGTPPSIACLDQLEAQVAAGDLTAAAMDAIDNSGAGDQCTDPAFYNVTLKNFITPWTNEEQTVFAPLNDYTATVIGIIRDDTDFREILSGDILYTGTANTYSNSNNDHYAALEDSGADLSDPAQLVATTQSAVTGLPANATAGVITTRAAARAFFIDGTNRAMFRFTLLNHLCTDLEQIKDPTRAHDRVTRDVARSPGGDSRIFMNACVGCHAGMDPLRQALAYYDFEYPVGNMDGGQMVYNATATDTNDDGTPTRVQEKYRINTNNFEFGYVVPDDQWDNYWRAGPNSALGWDSALSGTGAGAKSMGQELAHSEAFARCQVEKVFKAVCLRAPVDAADRSQIDTMISTFKGNTYKLKQVFADSAAFCPGN